jgi:hypothetical protein
METKNIRLQFTPDLGEEIRKYVTCLDELVMGDERSLIDQESLQRLFYLKGKLLASWETDNSLQDLMFQHRLKIQDQVQEIADILNPIVERVKEELR